MSGWKEYNLNEVAEIKNGKSRPKDLGNIPVYGGNGILGYANKYNVEHESIVIGRVGAYCGAVYYENMPAWISDNALYAKVRNGFSAKYLYYILTEDNLNKYAGGSSHPLLTQGRLKDLVFSIPDLPTQTAIAEILSSLDNKIELNNQINKNLEALAQVLFKRWFVDFEFPDKNGQPYKSSGGAMVESELGEIPEGWSVGVLSDIIDFANGNAFSSKELLSEDTGDCYHVFKMGHIKKGGGLNANGTKSYYERSNSEKLKKFVLRIGDLLMCMTDMKGNVALLGHTALMNENDKYIVNQRVGLLRPKNNLSIDYPYLYILTNSTQFIEDLRSRANSGVQVNLSTSEIKTSKILIPPQTLNFAYDKVAKSFFDNIFNITKENENLTKLRDTLLPKLISGEITVNDIQA